VALCGILTSVNSYFDQEHTRMADMIRYSIDVAAKPAEIYAGRRPQVGAVVCPGAMWPRWFKRRTRQVTTTKDGKGEFMTQDFPALSRDYGKATGAYESIDPFSDKVTRPTLDGLATQSLAARVFQSAV
jgi:hypothetical protein